MQVRLLSRLERVVWPNGKGIDKNALINTCQINLRVISLVAKASDSKSVIMGSNPIPPDCRGID